jgi:NADH-quinone oxidoreductase subunit L
MYELLWTVPAFPFLGALTLMLFGRRLPRFLSAVIGAGSIGLAAAVSVSLAYRFLTAPPEHQAFTQTLWRWMHVDTFAVNFALYLDPLSLVMICVVTVIGFLIHVYSIEYMTDDPSYAKFFAYMNLFVGSMLMLVLGDSLVLLYLG